MDKFIKFMFGFGLFILAMFWGTFCCMMIWNWLAVPILHLPSITMAGSVGLGCIVQLFKGVPEIKELDNKNKINFFETFVSNVFQGMCQSGMLLLMAYIVTRFL